VKVFGIIVIVVVLLAVGLMFLVGGEHGPGRHTQSGEAGGQGSSSGVVETHVPLEGSHG
jgi:hypothetical protein